MTSLFDRLGRQPRTIGLALVVALVIVLVMTVLSAYLPALGNPLLLVGGAVVAFGLVLARSRP